MELLRQLLEQARQPKDTDGAVDDIDNANDPLYVPVPKPGPSGKGKNKKPATTDRAMNSLIQTTWFYNNSDAS